MRPKFRVIAHRGASIATPENTIAAFRRSIERGTREVEFDCQLTSDEQVVPNL